MGTCRVLYTTLFLRLYMATAEAFAQSTSVSVRLRLKTSLDGIDKLRLRAHAARRCSAKKLGYKSLCSACHAIKEWPWLVGSFTLFASAAYLR